jgi:hypothetical protein
MAANRVFISYKHEPPWVDMAGKFRIKLANYAPEWNLDYFIDSRQIAAGTPWRASVDEALAGCTHLLVLLCDTWWESDECQRELKTVLERRAAGADVAPYFVLAEAMKPQYLRFAADGSAIGDVRRVGDFQFLGPYDDARRLVALQSMPPAQWGDAVEKMLTTLKTRLH